jgi:hypothetical protein
MIWSNIDYKRFNIKDRKLLDGLLVASVKANDMDNANIAYEWEVAYIRVYTPRWVAHKVVVTMENVWPIPICFVEVYAQWQGLRWSVARIDFYGAFFHFKDFLPVRYIAMYNHLMDLSETCPEKVRITRIDVAFDFSDDFPQNGGKWITPSKNSWREVSCYRHKTKWNSYWYTSPKNSGYWVRMYDKLVDIAKQWKQNWYWWSEKLPTSWTRIEFEFYPPYANRLRDDYLIEMVWERIMGKMFLPLWLVFRPCFDFKVEKAYTYFERYARLHGIKMEDLLDELIAYHIDLTSREENI